VFVVSHNDSSIEQVCPPLYYHLTVTRSCSELSVRGASSFGGSCDVALHTNADKITNSGLARLETLISLNSLLIQEIRPGIFSGSWTSLKTYQIKQKIWSIKDLLIISLISSNSSVLDIASVIWWHNFTFPTNWSKYRTLHPIHTRWWSADRKTQNWMLT